VLAPGAVYASGNSTVYLIGGIHETCCSCGTDFTSDVWRAFVSPPGCSGDPGFAITTPADAPIGEAFDICLFAPGGDGIALMVSLGQGPTATPYGSFCLDFPPLVIFTFDMPAAGTRCFHTHMPCDPNLVGVTGYLQFVALKGPGAADGLSNQTRMIVVDHG